MSRLKNIFLDFFAPRSWTPDLQHNVWCRRVKGTWQYRPMTADEREEQSALWAIR